MSAMDPFRRRPTPEPSSEPGSARREARAHAEPHAGHSESRLRAEAHGSKRGRRDSGYERIRQILLGYLSPILVDSVLDRALHARNLSPALLSDAALAEVTADIMVGLRLFVPEERLSQLMLELAETLDRGEP
jgi:hypothetical protein